MYLLVFKEIQKNYRNTKIEKGWLSKSNVASSPVFEQWIPNCTDRDNNVKVKKFYTRFFKNNSGLSSYSNGGK